MLGGYVCSASPRGKPGRTRVKETVSGQRPIRKLFSKEQRAFFATHAPEGAELDGLSVLGRITVFKLQPASRGVPGVHRRVWRLRRRSVWPSHPVAHEPAECEPPQLSTPLSSRTPAPSAEPPSAEVAGIEPTGRGSPVPLVLKTRGATRPRSPPTGCLPRGIRSTIPPGDSLARLRQQGDPVLKKLLILLILVAIGVAVARKVREV
jgi:hypothetical protein